MKRVGCTLEVKPELVDEYNAIHASIWLNMLDALRRHR
ncbi:MAG: L-rhamnose mutarotase [Roseiflexus sp.]|jgi:L-rhamnose mutarotase|nr:L-rhamnose mutarotase [Roseiflexus sp.]MBO9337000.1 L-rhamnose mutarotase [Roseiflexus sp.]MBO9341382.1 L-rhamnose mutarotase [Roseiflexus sp.]MBO9364420.1 L-rhamnose mutarotase [Roseiflexus sp.]MBO9383540.1 L-rhamnose mutarotase [Roseiflexus sp.]